ncbi:DUF6233 domain-containing protein [Streptomyces sp. NPDC048248]|uniref:DUF6233 domain-containing protein n=1 Tax=Streptomyces sp. NPDC048248 TaxID=3365523 RepID=UPI00371B380A
MRRRIAEVEEREASQPVTAPPTAQQAFYLQMDIGADPAPVAVHVGECPVGGKRLHRIAREEAVGALASGVESCLMRLPARELRPE